MSAGTPNEHSVDNPKRFNEATNTNAMHACEMSLTYVRGGLLKRNGLSPIRH